METIDGNLIEEKLSTISFDELKLLKDAMDKEIEKRLLVYLLDLINNIGKGD